MGFMFVIGHCCVTGCGRQFTFNAELVPSYKGEPICATCIEKINTRREAAGLEPWPVHPDAYEPQEVT